MFERKSDWVLERSGEFRHLECTLILGVESIGYRENAQYGCVFLRGPRIDTR